MDEYWASTQEEAIDAAKALKARGLSEQAAILDRLKYEMSAPAWLESGRRVRAMPKYVEILDPSSNVGLAKEAAHRGGISTYYFGGDTPETRAHERFHADNPTPREEYSLPYIDRPSEQAAFAAEGPVRAEYERLRRETDAKLSPEMLSRLKDVFNDADARRAVRMLEMGLATGGQPHKAPEYMRRQYATALAQVQALHDRFGW